MWVLPSAVFWGILVMMVLTGGKGWSWLRACPLMVASEQCLVVCRMYLEGCKMSFFSLDSFSSSFLSFFLLFFLFVLTISLSLPPDCIRIDCSLSKWFYPFFWLKCFCLLILILCSGPFLLPAFSLMLSDTSLITFSHPFICLIYFPHLFSAWNVHRSHWISFSIACLFILLHLYVSLHLFMQCII